MDHFLPVSSISEAIQLAVAPVFLLTGIGAILSVLTMRLGRVVDRARLVERRIAQISSEQHKILLLAETDILYRRIQSINWAIRLSVSSALLICVVVMSLFVGDFVQINLGTLIVYLFVLAMMLLILALVFLLFEVSVSTRKILQRTEHLLVQPDDD
jgi:Protein of unknown function (DUF2721)